MWGLSTFFSTDINLNKEKAVLDLFSIFLVPLIYNVTNARNINISHINRVSWKVSVYEQYLK